MSLLVEEFFLFLFLAGTFILSLWEGRFPKISPDEWRVLALLFTLLVAVKGLELSEVLKYLALRLEGFKYFPLLLVFYTAILSMFVTNDAALLTVVPLTLLLRKDRELIPLLVVLEILAANIGSALSPFGNPQNIYLIHHYGLTLRDFLSAVVPLFLPLLFFLLLLTPGGVGKAESPKWGFDLNFRPLSVSLLAFFLFLGVFFKVFPVWVLSVVPFIGFLYTETLKVDYNLLITLLVFFAFSSLVKVKLFFLSPIGVFVDSVFLSQVVSNVPVAVILAKLTPFWKPLLLGSNIGGFGTPIASLANLIGIRLYLRSGLKRGIFWFLFWSLNLSFLVIGVCLFLLLEGF